MKILNCCCQGFCCIELGVTYKDLLVLYCKIAVAHPIASKPAYHECMEHILVDYHFIREKVTKCSGQVRIWAFFGSGKNKL